MIHFMNRILKSLEKIDLYIKNIFSKYLIGYIWVREKLHFIIKKKYQTFKVFLNKRF